MPGILATIGRSGGPVTSAVWYGLEGDLLVVSTPADGTKAHNVRRDGRVSFAVDAKERPYCGVAIEGRATVVEDDAHARWRRIAERYVGSPLPPEVEERSRVRQRVIIEIVPGRVRTWNLPEDQP